MIEVQSLSRYYGSRCAVDEVSFAISSNEVVGFLGLNGAGKSTTLKVLAGLLAPSTGTVRIDGVDMSTAPVSFRERIGYLPEDAPLYQEMTVSEFLRFIGGLRGMTAGELTTRLPEVVARCHLEGTEDRVIGELSHGYRKRVGIAQAIIHRPKLVILDEPISGLDPVQIVEMRRVIKGLSEDSTVLVSSHILHEISQTCDRILVLKNGRKVAEGTEQELAGAMASKSGWSFELRGAVDAVRAALEGSGIASIVELSELRDDIVSVRAELSPERPEDVVAALVAAGIGVRRVEETRGELEGIFLDLTREGDA